jgi:hypothetical protein
MQFSHIIRLRIRHYQALLKLDSTTEIRPQVIKLIATAQAQLPLAEAEELEREHRAALSAE